MRSILQGKYGTSEVLMGRMMGWSLVVFWFAAPLAADWKSVVVTQNASASSGCTSVGMLHVAVGGFDSLRGLSTEVVYERLKKQAADKGADLVVMIGGVTKVEHNVGDVDLQADGEAFRCKTSAPSKAVVVEKPVNAAGTDCAKAFTVAGSMIRGTTYKTSIDVPQIDRAAALDRLASGLQKDGVEIVSTDAAAGTITAQASNEGGHYYAVDLTVAETPGGVNVGVSIKLPAGTRSPDDAMRDWLCSVVHRAAVPQTASPASAKPRDAAATPSPSGVEERLRKLDDLLKKGLITPEDFQKKKAEILKDL
jgi:hypothetical protein